jgi:hypothetical protein
VLHGVRYTFIYLFISAEDMDVRVLCFLCVLLVAASATS